MKPFSRLESPAGILAPVQVIISFFSVLQRYAKLASLVAAGCLYFIGSSAQTTRTWQPVAGGAWTTAANWSPNGVPASNDYVVIDKDLTGAITGVPNITLGRLRISGNCQFDPGGTNQTVIVTDSFVLAEGKTFSFGITNSKMNFTIAATAKADIRGQFVMNATTPAGNLNCNGLLMMSDNAVIRGAGAFALNAGATMRIGSAAGISAGTAQTGNIQVTGVRNFNPAANYEYAGGTAQVTGDGFPDQFTGNLLIINTSGVTLTSNRIVTTGKVFVQAGNFQVNNRLTMGNNTNTPAATMIIGQGSLTGALQGSNWYSLIYAGSTKTTGDEFSGAGLRNVTINMAQGESVVLSSNKTIPGTLDLSMGMIQTGAFKLILSGTASTVLSGGSLNSYINGNLQRSIAAGANSYVYPIGSNEGYAPVTIQFAAGTTAGTLTGYTNAGDFTEISGSRVNPVRSVNRNWNFTPNSGLGTVSYGATFTWQGSDQDANFDHTNAILGRYTSGAWTYPVIAAKNTSSIQASSLTGFGDFQVGKVCINTKVNVPPVNTGICSGENTFLSVVAEGEGELSYRWLIDGLEIEGADTAEYFTGIAANYQVRVSAECGTVLSDAVEVFIKTPTAINVQPRGGAKCAGEQLAVVADGYGTFSYQWKKDGEVIPESNSSFFAVSEPGNYTVDVSADCGVVTSDGSLVSINTPTTITKQPQDISITYGDNASFRIDAIGTDAITYKWQQEAGEQWTDMGQELSINLDTASQLSLAAPKVALSGSRYRCVVNALCGDVNSDVVTLSVAKAPLLVSANDLSKFYGAELPVLTTSYTGFKLGETFATSGLSGEPVLVTTAGTYSNIGNYPISIGLGTLAAENYDLSSQNGTLSVTAAPCPSTGTLLVSQNCIGSPIQLSFRPTSGTGPYTLVINDSVYKDIAANTAFFPGTATAGNRESIWGNDVIGEAPGIVDEAPVELGFKFKVNTVGEIKGVRFYKLPENTGVHTGSLWRADGLLLATATFTNETESGWQQVDFDLPVKVDTGVTYIASYFAPNGRYAYTATAFDSLNGFTSPSGNVRALSEEEGQGNGVYKYSGGFPNEVSPSNANYYVDVVFQIPIDAASYEMTGVISSTGCATNALPIQRLNLSVKPSIAVTVQKPFLECVNSTDGFITLTATGCNAPFTYSLDNGKTYQTENTFSNLTSGTYTVRVKDARNDIKDTTIIVGVDKAVWTGAVNSDWFNAGNWSTLRVPGTRTHVIIPSTINRCQINTDAVAASIQVSQGVTVRVLNNRKLTMTGTCSELPQQ